MSWPACGPCLVAAEVFMASAAALLAGPKPLQTQQESVETLVAGPFQMTFYPDSVRKLFKSDDWVTEEGEGKR